MLRLRSQAFISSDVTKAHAWCSIELRRGHPVQALLETLQAEQMTQCITSRASSRRSIAALARCDKDPAVWRQPGTIGWEATDTEGVDALAGPKKPKASPKVLFALALHRLLH